MKSVKSLGFMAEFSAGRGLNFTIISGPINDGKRVSDSQKARNQKVRGERGET